MSNHRVIATAGIIAVGVGSANAVLKEKRLPTARFLVGSGVAFLILSALADMGEGEIANALAIAVASTVVLGEGGGVLSYINNGEMDTQKRHTPKSTPGSPVPRGTPASAPANGNTAGISLPSLTIPNFPINF